MVLEEIIVLILSCLIAVGIIAGVKLIFKKWLEGWQWIFPISMLLGFGIMLFTTSEDGILMMLKENLIWAFVISMIFVNFKFLVRGIKNRVDSSQEMLHGIKTEVKKMKPSFGKKKPKDQNEDEEE